MKFTALVILLLILLTLLAFKQLIKFNRGLVITTKDELSNYNFKDYCARHGYRWILVNEKGNKYEEILKTFEKTNAKWIFWSDSESIFLNHNLKLADIYSQSNGYALLIPEFSSTQLFIRKTPRTKEILETIIGYLNRDCGYFILENPKAQFALNGYQHICMEDGRNYWKEDYGLLVGMLEYDHPLGKYLKRVPQNLFASPYPNYSIGDLLVSFSEEENPRIRKMNVRAAVRNLDSERGEIRNENMKPIKSIKPINE